MVFWLAAKKPNTRPYKATGSPVGSSVGWRVGEGQEGAYISSMAIVSVSLLKARLSEFLRRVRAGETLVVTDRGAPVAIVASLPEGEYESAMNVLVQQGLLARPGRGSWDRVDRAPRAFSSRGSLRLTQ